MSILRYCRRLASTAQALATVLSFNGNLALDLIANAWFGCALVALNICRKSRSFVEYAIQPLTISVSDVGRNLQEKNASISDVVNLASPAYLWRRTELLSGQRVMPTYAALRSSKSGAERNQHYSCCFYRPRQRTLYRPTINCLSFSNLTIAVCA